MNEREFLIVAAFAAWRFFSVSPGRGTFFVEGPMGKVSMTNILKYLYTFLIVKIISFSLFHSGKYGSSCSIIRLRRCGFSF